MSRLDGLYVSSGMAARVASGIVGSGGATAVAAYQPMVLLGAVGIVLVLIVGVVLPAVWSRSKERRAAAARVLRELLAPIRPTIPKTANPLQRTAAPAPRKPTERDLTIGKHHPRARVDRDAHRRTARGRSNHAHTAPDRPRS
jgi:hypothetical protein